MPVATGGPAPRAQATTLGGPPVDLAGLAARGPALLFFYKADCAASVAAAHVVPRLAAIPGVTVAAVSQDGAAETRQFAADHRFVDAVRVLVDPEPWPASSAYRIAATPTLVLLGPGARIEAVAEGWRRDEANALAARAAALAGVPAAAVSSPADGPAYRPG